MSNRPKPRTIRLLQGNAGKRPLNESEPQPELVLLPCPEHFHGYEREAWQYFAPTLFNMGVLSVADYGALEALCEAVADYKSARDALWEWDSERERKVYRPSYSVTGDSGQTYYRPKPEVAIVAESWKRVKGMLIEFGLTPATRTKVKCNLNDKLDPIAELRERIVDRRNNSFRDDQ